MFPSPGGAQRPQDDLFAGRYAVDGQLPWGGRAAYYRATSEGTPLIICILPMDLTRSTRAEAGFSKLIQGLGGARSKSLPRLLDAGAIDGVPYLVFDDTRGPLLRDVLRERPLQSSMVLRIAGHVLSALQAVHARGIVHGDLTPQNIVLTRQRDGTTSARLIGTGILPFLRSYPEASAHPAPTGSGQHAVAYMAPELIGTRAFPASADLYAVGTLLHHMVRGAPPVGWEDDEGFEDMPGLPEIIRRAMARHSDARYPNATSMLAALEWLEVESLQLNPQTQDIAPWMERSTVGSVPVPALASTRPPPYPSSHYPAGTVLTVSGARPRPEPPREPALVEHSASQAKRYWTQILLLLVALGTMWAVGHWWPRQSGASSEATPAAEHVD